MAARKMKLGLFIRPCGHHIASLAASAARRPTPASTFRISSRWRRPPSAACSTCCSRRISHTVWTAVGIGHRPRALRRLDGAVTLLSALSGYTKNIGLVCTASTSFEQPYSLARKFATLDLISGGRSGWNVVTSGNETEAQNFSKEPHLPKAERYKRGREFVEVVRGAVGFLGRGRLPPRQGDRHLLRPLEDARAQPPWRSSTTCAARSTSRARRRASRSSCRPARPTTAVSSRPKPRRWFSRASRFDRACARISMPTSKAAWRAIGRAPDDLKVLPGLSVIVAPTRAEAEAKFQSAAGLAASRARRRAAVAAARLRSHRLSARRAAAAAAGEQGDRAAAPT